MNTTRLIKPNYKLLDLTAVVEDEAKADLTIKEDYN